MRSLGNLRTPGPRAAGGGVGALVTEILEAAATKGRP
jgi:hypothetical protein